MCFLVEVEGLHFLIWKKTFNLVILAFILHFLILAFLWLLFIISSSLLIELPTTTYHLGLSCSFMKEQKNSQRRAPENLKSQWPNQHNPWNHILSPCTKHQLQPTSIIFPDCTGVILHFFAIRNVDYESVLWIWIYEALINLN